MGAELVDPELKRHIPKLVEAIRARALVADQTVILEQFHHPAFHQATAEGPGREPSP